MCAQLMAALVSRTLCSRNLVAPRERVTGSTCDLQRWLLRLPFCTKRCLNKAATICLVAGLKDDNQCPLSLQASSAAETRLQLAICYINHTPRMFRLRAWSKAVGVDIEGVKLALKKEPLTPIFEKFLESELDSGNSKKLDCKTTSRTTFRKRHKSKKKSEK